MVEIPCRKKPCPNCPFRRDAMRGWLGAERMAQILDQARFVCHKDNGLQCAGHMLIKGEANDFVRLAGRLRIDLKLRGRALVFDSERACVEHHR